MEKNTLIYKKIKEKGIKKKFISEKLQISDRTLYNWTNYENIDNIIKFIDLLKFLNININDFLNDYKKNSTNNSANLQ